VGRANRAFSELAGRGRAAVRGKAVDRILSGAPELVAAARAARATGAARYRIPLQLGAPGGSPRELEGSAFRLREAGGSSRVVLTLRDVAAARASERSEREARARAERAAERLGRLQQVTAALSAAAGEAEVAQAVFEVGLQVLGASGGSISFPDGADLVHVVHAFGSLARRGGGPAPHPERLRVPLAEAFHRLEPVWIESAAELVARYPRLVEPDAAVTDGAWVAIPLVVRERPLGVLGLGFASSRRFDEEERAFVVALAQQCAQAIERARLFEAQKEMRAQAEQAADERESLVKELRRTLRERDESMALLDALFENAPVGLALLDREMRYVRVNAQLAATNGVPTEQHVGRSLWEVVPRIARDELLRDFESVLRTRTSVVDRAVTGPLRAGDPVRSFLVSWYPVAVGERLIGVGALVREVTEQRRAEQFQRQLLGVVGHDLRSPLMAITASAELLLAGPLGEREARSAGRILRAAHRIDGIIRALVDFTMLQVGSGIPLQRRASDLVQVVRAVAEEAETAHPGRAVRIEGPIALGGEWDPDRIGQAIANLVGNALQYGPEEAPVEVSCREEGAEAVVEVRNAGEPIPEDLLPHLFEPFRRGGDERTQRRKGLGLGLFIAGQIVGAHGGQIEVRSAAGAGTTFAVRLPRAAPGTPGSPVSGA
jgi:PAS domain S-box-containing protein